VLQFKRGNHAGARGHFERALAIQPDALEPLDGLTALDIVANKPAAARARVDAQLTRTPRSIGVLMLAARVYARADDNAAAERALKTALEINPNEPAVYDELARLYASQKQLDRAVREFETLARSHPQSVGPPALLGVIYLALNRLPEAALWFEKGLALDPRNAVIANNLAWLYADQGGDLDEALRLALLAKEQIADRPEVDDTLGWIYLKRGEVGLALPLLRSTVERDPNNPVYQYHLGRAYEKAGKRSDARDALQKALRHNTTFPGASNAKAVLRDLH
jgi:tetratricopeptide (TPR) repeat protein